MTNNDSLPDLSGDSALGLTVTRVSQSLVASDSSVELQELVSLVARQTGSSTHCGITVINAVGLTETIAASDDLPVRVDWLQHSLQEGPRVGAGQNYGILSSNDFSTEDRWVEFSRLCVGVLGMRSMLSIPIPCPAEHSATMNMYSGLPSAFTVQHVNAATRFACLASRGVELHFRNVNNSEALPHGRSPVATALGIVMARYRLDSSDAFNMLRNASRDLGRDLVTLAAEVVLDGRLPAREMNRARRERRGNICSNTQLTPVVIGGPRDGRLC